MRLVKRLAVAGVLVLGVSGSAVAGFNEGVDAYNRGDFETAYKEFLPLAQSGVAAAQFNLGVQYAEGQGVPQDYAQAVKWFRKAAEQGDAAAQYNLGIMYGKGLGVPQDYAKAERWYRKAAEQGRATAQYFLGVQYAEGQGVPQDYAEAVKWFRKAAEQGDAAAQFNLGVRYGKGQGVPQDYVRAHMWTNLAAAQGQEFAAKNRDIMDKRMTRAQIAEAQRLAQNWRPKQQATVTTSSTRSATNRGHIARTQRNLAALGYDPGLADGILGPKTRAAIRAFQAREGLPVTGVISESLEAALRSASRAIAD